MNRLSPEEEAQRMDLYKQGLTDKGIAEKLYVSWQTINIWRTKRGLSANGGAGRGGVRAGSGRRKGQSNKS